MTSERVAHLLSAPKTNPETVNFFSFFLGGEGSILTDFIVE